MRAVRITNVFRAAHSYAERCIPVIPLNGKIPLIEAWGKASTTDHDVINAWARRWPRANIGIPTGFRSGLLVLDLDRKEDRDGLDTLRSLEVDLGELPETLTAQTWSGGQHRYFRMPSVEIRNSAGKVCGFDAPGIDIRGEGGQVAAPPSEIGSKSYRWTIPVKPVELPTTWIMALAPQRERPSAPAEPWTPRDARDATRVVSWCLRALQSEARDLAAAPQGTRNDRLWRAAAALGGLIHTGAIDTEDVRRALTWACSTWATRDARKDAQTLEGGLTFGLANPRNVEMGDASAA